MYGVPKELDLSPVVGNSTTQLRVGPFDLQFSFGGVHFFVQSRVDLYRGGEPFAHWESGRWPDAGFYEILNAEVTKCAPVGDKRIVFEFANGIEMHLDDDSDRHESFQICIDEPPAYWVV